MRGGREEGFTLLEILVAVTIMGLAYVAILENFSQSARSIARMEAERDQLIAGALTFERALLALDQEGKGSGDKGLNVVAEGSAYELVQLASEDGTFTTLKLKRK